MFPQPSTEQRAKAESFGRQHLTGLVTLLFTDMVDSTALKQGLGRQSFEFFEKHHQLLRDCLARFSNAQEIDSAGDSFLLVFAVPSDAVEFALLVQSKLRTLFAGTGTSVQDRIGINLGEVVIREPTADQHRRDLFGLQVDLCSRVMSLAKGGQILVTRQVFDSARQALKGEALEGVDKLSWVSHGHYLVKGVEDPVEVCEVAEMGHGLLTAPTTSEKARRYEAVEAEPVLGWRPAVGQVVPNTQWVIEQHLGYGGFGEVWLGRHQKLKEQRVFKFCFQADRVRSLKREVTLFRLLKERMGGHPNIVGIQDVFFEEPPYYVMMDYAAGNDLAAWCAEQGGIDKVPLDTRFEIVAQVADALQAAHDAGIIHRDVKPANILVSGVAANWRSPLTQLAEREDVTTAAPEHQKSAADASPPLRVKLTDFGIGQVLSEEYLAGVTRAGFTQTMAQGSSSQTGTQLYMAPELLAGKPASIRSDIYSLGVVLYQLVVADFKRPVATDWADEIPDPLLREDLKHCFAGKPEDRFPGAAQFAKNLRTWRQRQEALARQQSELAARERAAYRRGVVRSAAIAGSILFIIGLLAIFALHQSRVVTRSTENLRHNSYAADVNLAQRTLDEGNLGQALELLQRHVPKWGQADLRGWEWRHLWQQCQSDELFTLGHHSNIVTVVSFFPDGVRAASASADGRVKLWDLTRREEIAVLEHEAPVWSMALAPDGTRIATRTESETILWHVGSRRRLASFPIGQVGMLSAVCFSPDGATLFISSDRGAPIRVVSTEAKTELGVLLGDRGKPISLAVSPDGRQLASGYGGPDIMIWDCVTRLQKATLPGHRSGVKALAFSPDGKLLASGAFWQGEGFNEVRLWDISRQQQIGLLTNHTFWISSLAFTPDGKTLVSASADQTIRLWDVATLSPLGTLKGHRDEVWSVAISPDGRMLLTGGKDMTVRCWSPQPKARGVLSLNVADYPGFDRTRKVFNSPDGGAFATLGRKGSVVVWDARTLQRKTELSIPSTLLTGLALSPGATNLIAGYSDGSLTLWQTATSQSEKLLNVGTNGLMDLAFSHSGQILLADLSQPPGRHVNLRLWDIRRRRPMSFDPLPCVRSIWCLSPDEHALAVSQTNFTVVLWDIAQRREVTVLRGHSGTVYGIAFSPDGKTMATAGDDGTARLWDVSTGSEIAVLSQGAGVFFSPSFSPDGRTLMAGSRGILMLWHVLSRRPLAVLKGHSPGAYGPYSWFVDANTLVSHEEKQLRVWRAPSFEEIEAGKQANGRSP